MTAAHLQNSPDVTVHPTGQPGIVRVTVNTVDALNILALGSLVSVGGSVTLVTSDANRLIGRAETSGLFVSTGTAVASDPVRVTDLAGNPGTILYCDRFFTIGTDGTIVASMIPQSTVANGSRVANWVTPGTHESHAISLPVRPSKAAKAAIMFLMDQLLQPTD